MKKRGFFQRTTPKLGMMLILALLLLAPAASFAATYNFTQVYDGVTVSGTLTFGADDFWTNTPGYTATSTSTAASLSGLSLSLSFSGTAPFNLSDYTIKQWNIFLATPSSTTTYYIDNDAVPRSGYPGDYYYEGFFAWFTSADGKSNLYITAGLTREIIGFDWDKFQPIYSDEIYWGEISLGDTYDVFTTNYMAVTTSGASSVPVPAAAWLLGSGLCGLCGLRRKIVK